MARGLTRDQIGVTEQMVRAFGDAVFELSHNHQIRVGDPIRELDFDAIENQRAALGLSDAEIAARIGLTRNQVLYIRTIMERRRFRTGHYQRLLELGGGRRFRNERFTPHEERFTYSDAALELRAAMRFDPALVKRYISEGWWHDDTLAKWLEQRAEGAPERPAIRLGKQTISYGEFHDVVTRLMAGLHGIGIRKGDVVAVQLPNIPEFLISYLAITGIGGVMSTLHMPYRGAEIETLLAHSSARAVICQASVGDFAAGELMVGLQAKLPLLDHVITVGDAPKGAVALAALGADDTAGNYLAPVASDPFLLLYTSGTTAAPKGVPLSYHNMLSNARVGIPEHQLDADDIILSAAPFSHLFGLYSFHLALCAGACSLLLPVFSPPGLAETIDQARPTALFTAPAHMAACIGGGLFDTANLSSLKLAVVSGSALPSTVARNLDDRLPNGHVSQLWGMTETQAGLYTRPDDSLDIVATSAGRPSPGTEVRVAAEDGQTQPCGDEGELQVRGALLFPGYLNNPDANRAAFAEGGWFRTGDLATIDQAGNVSITGRLKDIINRGGVKYNPIDVEDLLTSHPKILQAAIVPVPDDVLGERACCFVTLASPDVETTLEELCDYLLENKIAKNKLPEFLEVVGEMPMTPTRKIIKGRLKRTV